MLLAAIPSPTQGVWHLGPMPIRAYAFCIIAGILVAAWLTERRYVERGGRPGVINQIATWGVPLRSGRSGPGSVPGEQASHPSLTDAAAPGILLAQGSVGSATGSTG